MATETAPPQTAPAKFSRYRSVRRAQAQQEQQAPPMPEMPPVPPIEKTNDSIVSRSMSRYHRRPPTSHSPEQKAPPVRYHHAVVPPLPATAPSVVTSNGRDRAVSSPQRAAHGNPRQPNTSKSRIEAAPVVATRDEAKQLIEKEAERQRRIRDKLKQEKRAKIEAEEAERERQSRLRIQEEEEAARRKAQREADEAEELRRQKQEQEHGRRLQKAESASRLKKREDEARKAKHDEEARKAQASRTSPPKHHGVGLSLFHRKRKEDVAVPTDNPANTGRPRQTSETNNHNRDLDTIRPGGGGAVLGIDAPISAINAGDRRVLVVCNKQEILLPVTPTTTPLDLIKSASTCLTERIDIRTAVILESFQKVGVKRPLRNYEHVRDVMNSWDDDKQNDLVIVDSLASGIDQQDLLAFQVSETKPEGMGCYIHYSSKPGKWSKRYLTLQPDGQLTMGKNENSKDQENICHLSDFDIYSPTERKLSTVRPPKKICYAVKSQQKSNIYLDETRFVHFFCTNDRNTASLFYKRLHGWRSWYLINVMGEGQKKSKSPESTPIVGQSSSRSRNVSASSEQAPGSGSHARNASVGSHYQLGSFLPLIDLGQFSKDTKRDAYNPGPGPEAAPLAKTDSKSMHVRKMSTRAKGPPPLSYNLGAVTQDDVPQSSNRQNSLTQSNGVDSGSETFAPGGLLGRKYSQRQRAVQGPNQSGPFTEGPSLLNNIQQNPQSSANDSGLYRRSSVRSTHGRPSGDIQRSLSTRTKPRPLVDLTPQYREPPQHSRKGKAFVPEGNSGPLIENATSIEEAIKVPPSTDWRAGARPSTARPNHGTYGTGGFERTRSLKGRGEGLAAYTMNNHASAPEDNSAAFTGGGLLAQAGFSQGNTPVGHGVMDGSKAKGPMLDMRENPTFATGSLLANVERHDRNRRQSVDLG